MKISHSETDGTVVFRLEGHLDSTTSAVLQTSLAALTPSATSRLVIDLGKVEYVSSAGLRVLLMAAKQMRAAGGEVALFGLTSWVREVFEISGIIRLIPIVESEQDAMRRVRP